MQVSSVTRYIVTWHIYILYIIVEAIPQTGQGRKVQEHLSEPEGKYLLISDMKAIFKIIY